MIMINVLICGPTIPDTTFYCSKEVMDAFDLVLRETTRDLKMTPTEPIIDESIVSSIDLEFEGDFKEDCYREYLEREPWVIPRSLGKVQNKSYKRSFNKIRSSLPRKFKKEII